MDQKLDLSVDTIITVINKEFRNDYRIIIEWYKIIEFTGFIYDGTVHPNETYPGVMDSEDSLLITIVDDPSSVLGGKVARFTNLEPGTGSIYWDFGDMAAIPGLDDDEIDDIIGYIRSEQERQGFEQ